MAYVPTPPGASIQPTWLYEELLRIAAELGHVDVLRMDSQARSLTKPRAVTLFYADGVNFDPGAGAGLYFFDGAYVKLAAAATVQPATAAQVGFTGVRATIS